MDKVCVHILTHPTQDRDSALHPLLEQLEREPVVVHLIPGVLGNIGAGRAAGFRAGAHDDSPVSYVDDDDKIISGVFDRVLECFAAEPAIDGCATREIHTVDGAGHGQRAFPYQYYDRIHSRMIHHVTAYRRASILPHLEELKGLAVTAEHHLTDRMLLNDARIKHIPFAGYVWDSHAGSTPSLGLARDARSEKLRAELWAKANRERLEPHIPEQHLLKRQRG